MNRASDDIVDFHFSISHNTFKYNTYLFAFPSVRNIKTMTIDAVFIAKIMFPVGIILLFFLVFLINIIAPVGIASKTLLFPARRNIYLAPLLRVHT